MAGPGVQLRPHMRDRQRHQTNATHLPYSALILWRQSVMSYGAQEVCHTQDSIRVNTSPGGCHSDWSKAIWHRQSQN